jgi:hypothetical protein
MHAQTKLVLVRRNDCEFSGKAGVHESGTIKKRQKANMRLPDCLIHAESQVYSCKTAGLQKSSVKSERGSKIRP